MIDCTTRFGSMTLKNPILAASGTFGYAAEFKELTDLSKLGGVATKGISPRPRHGNPPPRMCETASGMINSIGLENTGVDVFATDKLPFLRSIGTAVIVNFFGETFDEYVECAERLDRVNRDAGGIDALEMNISCPNVKRGGVEYGTDPKVAAELVRLCREVTTLPLWVKLTPNITDVVALAAAVADAGADAVSLINTLKAMAVNARTRRPRIATTFGGLSGPAIKPVALRMVFEVARAKIGLPICGIGGIRTAEDAVEFMIAGAACVQIGTQNFADPDCAARIVDDLQELGRELGVTSLDELVGTLQVG